MTHYFQGTSKYAVNGLPENTNILQNVQVQNEKRHQSRSVDGDGELRLFLISIRKNKKGYWCIFSKKVISKENVNDIMNKRRQKEGKNRTKAFVNKEEMKG